MNISNRDLTRLLKERTAHQVIKMFMNGSVRLNEQQVKFLLDLREEQREYEKRENEKINK